MHCLFIKHQLDCLPKMQIFLSLRQKHWIRFPSILPDPPCIHHKDPLLLPAPSLRFSSNVRISFRIVNVSLLLWELWQHFLHSSVLIFLRGNALMSCLLFPSIPAIPPGSSSMVISQSSDGVLKVKVIKQHVNKIRPLKWGIIIILMLRTKVARKFGNTTVGD